MPANELDVLVEILTDSLAELENCRRVHPCDWLQPILRRRRRAISTLRPWSRPQPRAPRRPAPPSRNLAEALGALIHTERKLIAVYDRALAGQAAAPGATLRSQRAEAEQALLEIASAAAGQGPGGSPPAARVTR